MADTNTLDEGDSSQNINSNTINLRANSSILMIYPASPKFNSL
jgi:hypothetical protein